jgi:SAM-dependent methyltransferase
MPPGHNKLCEVEDFADAELAATIREVFAADADRHGAGFPLGREYRKYWEIGMAVRGLRQFGALHDRSLLLGVGAGTESTIFHLTKFARMVFATDVYIQQDHWSSFAPTRMLWDPEAFAPFPFDERRLVVQHMDGRFLNYPDDTFDGIFSSGSIEHFGGLEDAAFSAYEMGRVLKPGGIMTVSTEFCVAGPTPGVEWPGLVLFSAEQLRKYVVEASGLEPVDDFSAAVSEWTRATVRPLSFYVDEIQATIKAQGDRPRVGEVTWSVYPHILLEQQGYTFGSVHLALRKTDRYPAADNAWARPTPEIVRERRWRPTIRSAEGVAAAAAGKSRGKLASTVRRIWRRKG